GRSQGNTVSDLEHGVLAYRPTVFFFSGRGRHTSSDRDWSSDVCSSDLLVIVALATPAPAWRERRSRARAGIERPREPWLILRKGASLSRAPGACQFGCLASQCVAMEFGLFTEFQCPAGMNASTAFDQSMEQMKAAEDLGFDAVWLAEIHFQKDRSVLSAPLVIASALAIATRRVK